MAGPEHLIESIAAWADAQPDVQAAFLVGSRARADRPADRWSDVDVALVVDDPARYLADDSWLSAFGTPILTFVERSGLGDFAERRVLYETGEEVDFAPFQATALPELAAGSPAAALVLRRGYRVLVDKVGIAALLEAAAAEPVVAPLPPTEAELVQVANDYWYHVLWAAKKLQRGETFMAARSCNCYQANLLLVLLGWHARLTRPQADTWHEGRFLERWADPQAVAELEGVFARYDPADIARALRAGAALFERLERDVAGRLGMATGIRHDAVRRHLDDILG